MGPLPVLPLYDAHNHLQDPWLGPHRDRILNDLAAIGLRRAVVNGTAEDDWAQTAALAQQHAFVLPSFGLHPWQVGNATGGWQRELRARLERVPSAGVGEIGVDRWILDRAKPDDPRLQGLRRAPLPEQFEAFGWQLELAAKQNRAVTIHCIDAWGQLLDFLRGAQLPHRGFLLHAYGGSAELAREFAELGAYFSFNGYFLGDRQSAKRKVFGTVPFDRLLAETDAPAMPLPAGKEAFQLPGLVGGNPINHPGNIGVVYSGLAELRGTTVDNLAAIIEANFHRLFG